MANRKSKKATPRIVDSLAPPQTLNIKSPAKVKAQRGRHYEMSLGTLPKVANAITPATWFDAVSVLMRSDIEVATLHFYHFVPDAAIEVGRFQTTQDNMKAIINLFARLTD